MRRMAVLIFFVLLAGNHAVVAKDVTPMQVLFTTKEIFPDCREVAIFVSREYFHANEMNIARASAQNHIKPHVYIIENSSDIGNALNNIDEGSILVVMDSDALTKSNNKLYILSKCKTKRISIVTSSPQYSESGALLGILPDDGQKIKVVLNLKHNKFLKEKFTPDFLAKVGVKEVIE